MTVDPKAKAVMLQWGDRSDDDITRLPSQWEARVADDSRVYFVDHDTKATQWLHPTNGFRYKVPSSLPYGWQKFRDANDSLVFVDHYGQMRSHIDPRLLTVTAVLDFPKKFGIEDYPSIRNSFRSLVRASKILTDVDLTGQVAMVTGGSSGLGYETALCLAKAGARVFIASRNEVKGMAAINRMKQAHPSASIDFLCVDLSSLHSVNEAASTFLRRGTPLNILVCNAGIFGGPFSKTVDGVESHFGVNHLGHFYLADLLTPVLKQSKPSRVVVVSSDSHWYTSSTSSLLDLQWIQNPSTDKYSPITAYGTSKLCNILFAMEFHRRYAEEGVSCNVVHPGNLLPTGLSRNAGVWYRLGFLTARLFTKSVEQAASTVVYCAAHPTMSGISGLYMCDCWPAEPSPEAQEIDTAAALWELSMQIIARTISE